jgi:uncharacterized membrane protein
MSIDAYALLKLAHVLSATLLFGTGLGTALFQWQAHRSGDVRAIAATARHVVLADWLFTTPAVIVQPVTGVLLARQVGYDLGASWLVASMLLYLVTGACWLPVVWIQIRVRELAADAAARGTALPERYHRLMRLWFALGWPAFAAVLLIFWLMLRKPSLWG